MKKITLWLFVFFLSWQIQAQINYEQNFNDLEFPTTLTLSSGFSVTNLETCEGGGVLRKNHYINAVDGSIETSGLLTNNTPVVVSFQWKTKEFNANTGVGLTVIVDYTINNGVTYTPIGATITSNTNTTCQTWTATIPATAIPAGSNFKLRIKSTRTAGDFYYYIDELSIKQTALTVPNCAVLTSPSNGASNVGNSVITWNTPIGIPTGYKLSVGTQSGGTNILNMQDIGNVTSYNLSNLGFGTTYFVKVVPYNNHGNAINCPEYSFTTCNVFSIPFSESFDSSSTSKSCWSVLNVNNDNDVWNLNYSDSPINGNASATLYTDLNNGANNDYLITPKITLTGNQRLVFKYKVQSSSEPNDFEVLLSTTGKATSDFTTTLLPLAAYSNTAVATKAIALTGITGGVYIAWRVPPGGVDGWRIYIDDVVVENIPIVAPPCIAIVSPLNGAINVANPTVSWVSSIDATGYKISIGTSAGASNIANLQNIGNVTSYTFNTNPGTTYFVRVYPYNTFGDATGCPEISFTTCPGLTNFSENFDSLTVDGSLPSCWNRIISGAATYATVGMKTDGFSPPNCISMSNSNSQSTAKIMLVTPYLTNLNTGTHRIKFMARNVGNVNQDIEVGTLSNPNDASTFTALQTIDLGNTYQEYAVSFAGYSGTNKYIAIRRLSTVQFTLVQLDNIIWEPIPNIAPNCVTITSPVHNAVNVANTIIRWNHNVDATGYKLRIGTTAGAGDILNMVNVGNVNNYSLVADAGTSYFVSVFPYNTLGQATGCTEIKFTTCDALDAPFIEPFSTFLPQCWQTATDGSLAAGPSIYGTSQWVYDSFGNVGAEGAIRFNIDAAESYNWLISPEVAIPGVGYELKFKVAATQYNTSTSPTSPWEADDKVEVLVATSGTSNWTVLYTFNNTNVPSNLGQNKILNLNAYQGASVRFAFRGVEGNTNGSADIDFFIDDFEIRLAPTAVPICASNVVATANPCGNLPNTISWVPTPGADGYKITIGTTAGGTQIANNLDLGFLSNYSFLGNLSTNYFYKIIPYNAFGSASNCTESNFTTSATGCYCVSNPTSNDGAGISNVQVVSTNFPTTDVSYFNHSATAVTVQQGINTNLQIKFETGATYYVYVLVDFNNDFDFNDAGEIVFTGESTALVPSIVNASFLVPSNAPLGLHRMRIVSGDFMITANPCYNGIYGVTLDFTINITPALSLTDFDAASFKAYPNPVTDIFTIAYASEISKVSVINLLGQEVFSEKLNATSTQINMSGYEEGVYFVQVTLGTFIKTIKIVKQK